MKSNLELVQELLESRLDNLNEKIDNNNITLADKIDANNKHMIEFLGLIFEQAKKTNGRLLVAEKDIKDIRQTENNHSMNCPRVSEIRTLSSKIDKLIDDSFLLQLWNKYPKQTTLGAALVLGGILISFGMGVLTIIEKLY